MGFQLMQILGLLGMYFDAVVVFITSHSLLFRLALARGEIPLALAILCHDIKIPILRFKEVKTNSKI